MLYRLYGLVINSEDQLNEVPPVTHADFDIIARRVSSSGFPDPKSDWFMTWHLPGGEPWVSFAKMDGGYLLRFNELADFTIDRNGKEVICMPGPGIPEDTIQHLLLDQVIPLVINLRGAEALHASAVLGPHGVIAFAGPAGSGKSTLVGSFLVSGYRHMSDDCLRLLKMDHLIYAIPAYPGLRLWKDALSYLFGDNGSHRPVANYTHKLRVKLEKKLETHCEEPRPLRRLYVLPNPSEANGKTDIVIEPLSQRDSLIALVKTAFRLDITDRNMLIRQFHFLEQVASSISVRRLTFPKKFKFLPDVREAILDDLKNTEN